MDVKEIMLKKLREKYYSPETLWRRMTNELPAHNIEMIESMLVVGYEPESILESARSKLPKHIYDAVIHALQFRQRQLRGTVKGQG